MGSFLGSAFIVLMPIVLSTFVGFLDDTLHLGVPSSVSSNLELMVFGALIIFFLIVEPHGLARLWQITKEKLGYGRFRIDAGAAGRSAFGTTPGAMPLRQHLEDAIVRRGFIPAAGGPVLLQRRKS